MKLKTINILSLGFGILLSGCMSTSIDDGEHIKRVGHVQWSKERAENARNLAANPIPNNAVSIFFLRKPDKDVLETSANLAVNDHFQVSLQPGNYTQVYSCSGINDLSAEITGHKNNDLLKAATSYDMEIGGTYYFDIDVTEAGQTHIQNIKQVEALAIMDNMQYQNHQISRVVRECPPRPARIELEILFDTDKSFVKNNYYPEIQRVADYMNKYPNTKAAIEGHTDSRASEQYNIGLSQRRVDAVAKILIEYYGIAASRLQAKGYGENHPRATNATTEGRQQNRRVIAEFSY